MENQNSSGGEENKFLDQKFTMRQLLYVYLIRFVGIFVALIGYFFLKKAGLATIINSFILGVLLMVVYYAVVERTKWFKRISKNS